MALKDTKLQNFVKCQLELLEIKFCKVCVLFKTCLFWALMDRAAFCCLKFRTVLMLCKLGQRDSSLGMRLSTLLLDTKIRRSTSLELSNAYDGI